MVVLVAPVSTIPNKSRLELKVVKQAFGWALHVGIMGRLIGATCVHVGKQICLFHGELAGGAKRAHNDAGPIVGFRFWICRQKFLVSLGCPKSVVQGFGCRHSC